mmetsp:Transcript_19754/g.46594  ORF Transcript_19754/g.46594 Transcript_19754/m.46594 type:complete len:228 (+) Transcript_19754:878-1561(+)
MIFLKVVWMRSKRLASSGSCRRMSSEPTKIASRYIHFDWTFIQTAITSAMVDMSFSHFCVWSRNGPTKRLALMEERFIIWSSSVSWISSVVRSTNPRSVPPLMYLATSKRVSRQVSAMSLMPFSIVSSLTAAPESSAICSENFSSCIEKSLPSVNVFGFISKEVPVRSMSCFQCLSRSASDLRFWMSGRDSRKPMIASSSILYGLAVRLSTRISGPKSLVRLLSRAS